MLTPIHWIENPRGLRLGIMARPRSGDWLEDEVDGWHRAGVGTVVSLLEAEEIAELGLGREAELCRARGMEFLSLPIADRGIPSLSEARCMAETAFAALDRGGSVAVHCRAGIGRSSLLAGAILRLSGMEAGAAYAAIGRARGLAVPDTEEQLDWLTAFAPTGHGDGRP